MVEIRTFEGDARELSKFTQEVWLSSYEGKMLVPLWSAEYFDWQILSTAGNRDYVLGAYDGSKLVGSLPGEAFQFKLHDRVIDAATGSWLTVHPDYRRQGVASQLLEEQRRRHIARGAAFIYAYVYTGARISFGLKFWSQDARTVVIRRVGFWVRLLNPSALAKWQDSLHYRLLEKLIGSIQRGRPQQPDVPGIRPYRTDDLDRCLELTHALSENVDLGYVWSRERLAHQLDYKGIPRTLVLERDSRVQGFVNYSLLDFRGRDVVRTAVIDLAAFGEMLPGERKSLMQAVLAELAAQGVDAAIMIRLSCYPAKPMLTAGFLPTPNELDVICIRMDPSFFIGKIRRIHAHFR